MGSTVTNFGLCAIHSFFEARVITFGTISHLGSGLVYTMVDHPFHALGITVLGCYVIKET